MMSIRSLADFNGSSLGGDSDWLTPPPSPPRPQTPGRHDEQGMGTSNWPPAETFTWPHTGTFSWPWTAQLPNRSSAICVWPRRWPGADHPVLASWAPPGDRPHSGVGHALVVGVACSALRG